MVNPFDFPLLVFALSLLGMWLSMRVGIALVRRQRSLDADARDDFGLVLPATLSLLGLVIGFTYSMAVSRYDQRKNLEEGEANAIGTAYVRADLLPAADANKVRALLREYLDQRIVRYSARDPQRIRSVDARCAELQTALWAAIVAPAAAQPNPMVALVVNGINDVLNAQGYAQAAAWNRIPAAAWALMATIAALSCGLVGYSARNPRTVRLLVLPAVLSIGFFLIADIDSPNGGVIRVSAENLESLAPSLRGP